MYPRVTVGPFGYKPAEGRYPLERPATLGMMRTAMRRPTVIEKWSPYQVALFEGAISIHGKVGWAQQYFDRAKQRYQVGPTVGRCLQWVLEIPCYSRF